MAIEGIWLLAQTERRFRHTPGGWIHGVDAGRWRDLAVLGAREVTLDELHGHRILSAGSVTRPPWEWRSPAEPVYVRVREARAHAELTWSVNKARVNTPEHGLVCAFSAEQWERRRVRVVALWAPELLGDRRGAIAAAGLDERASRREARSATAYRRALIHRGTREFGLTRRQLAETVQTSRGRIDQILLKASGGASASARDAVGADELLHRLLKAGEAHRRAMSALDEARRLRVDEIARGRAEGLSLARIAECLGVTRSRVQQLARR